MSSSNIRATFAQCIPGRLAGSEKPYPGILGTITSKYLERRSIVFRNTRNEHGHPCTSSKAGRRSFVWDRRCMKWILISWIDVMKCGPILFIERSWDLQSYSFDQYLTSRFRNFVFVPLLQSFVSWMGHLVFDNRSCRSDRTESATLSLNVCIGCVFLFFVFFVKPTTVLKTGMKMKTGITIYTFSWSPSKISQSQQKIFFYFRVKFNAMK